MSEAVIRMLNLTALLPAIVGGAVMLSGCATQRPVEKTINPFETLDRALAVPSDENL